MRSEELQRIKRAITTGTDLLINEITLAFDRQRQELTDAKNTIGQLRESISRKDREAEERTVRENEMIMTGDLLAHQLTYREHGPLLKKWWAIRGDFCSVCNGSHKP